MGKTALFFSGGKKSVLSKIKSELAGNKIDYLISIIDPITNSIPDSGIPEVIIKQQANAMGIPLIRVHSTTSESIMNYRKLDITKYITGATSEKDVLYFDELIQKLSGEHLQALEHYQTKNLKQDIQNFEMRTYITAIKNNHFNEAFLGMQLTPENLDKIEIESDLLSSKNEYHSFVAFALGFKQRLQFCKSMYDSENDYQLIRLREA